jgi:hypothetical protein
MDLFSLYSTDLVVGLWKATNGISGAVITISSVAPDSATGTFNVTLSTVDTDFPTAGGIINLTLVAPSDLSDGGVEGFEALVTKITVAP